MHQKNRYLKKMIEKQILGTTFTDFDQVNSFSRMSVIHGSTN